MSATTELSLTTQLLSFGSELPENSDVEQAIMFIVLLCSLTTIVINPFTMAAMMTMKKKAINVFIISLCGADLVTGTSTFLVKLTEIMESTNSRSVAMLSWSAHSLTTIGFFTSLNSAFLIGLDRAMAILRPTEYRTGATYSRGLKVVLLTWILNVSLIIVPLAMKIAALDAPLPVVTMPSQIFNSVYVQYVSTPLVGIWIVGNIVLYITIVIVYAKVSKKTNNTSAEKRTRRLTKLSLIVVGGLLVGSLPISILVSLPVPTEPPASKRLKIIHDILLIIMLIPTFSNNFIYAWNQPDFREAYSRILCCCKRNAVGPNTTNSHTAAPARSA